MSDEHITTVLHLLHLHSITLHHRHLIIFHLQHLCLLYPITVNLSLSLLRSPPNSGDCCRTRSRAFGG
ncbi:hypothetical protein HanHA300_Chr04g0132911 [Helianthus annuus]|nr:hypothetical protein HanHA300_Chr04g0132911 [Helianthus annuus]KAJ0596693.1 hypothetical protein HanHA89_Chr04g0145861 [Helianthus annuus]KAJ0757363.1 hypothetical protein HanLR1_Chr04g0137891 [Helianthus annuus]